MIAYTTLGVNDMERAVAFYDPVFAAIGGQRDSKSPTWTGYSRPGDRAKFFLTQPWDKAEATHGNGTMLAFEASSHAAVDSFHAAALANGGADEGPPGIREGTHYVAYIRDPDGNKLCAFAAK